MIKSIEIWCPVKGYEGLYEVSTWGRVKSLRYNKTNKIVILTPVKTKAGYLMISLCKDKSVKRFYIHRLVAVTFIPNPNNLPLVNHKDQNPQNNRVENLEWCTQKYNVNYADAQEKRIKKESKPVAQYTLDGKLVATYLSASDAGRQTGIHQGNISACCRGDKKTAGGFIWRYV